MTPLELFERYSRGVELTLGGGLSGREQLVGHLGERARDDQRSRSQTVLHDANGAADRGRVLQRRAAELHDNRLYSRGS